jgi:acetyl esterase
VLDLPFAPMDMVTDRAIGTESDYFQVRLYVPGQSGATDPLLVYFHGGGWAIGNLDTHDRFCRAVAAQAGCRVLSVDYRLAPEHPFPAAVDDALRAYRAVLEDPAAFGADPARIAVGGDSAGGNLTAVVCHLAAGAGLPRPCFQLLVYPSVDLRGDYASRRAFGDRYLLTEDAMRWFTDLYLPDRALLTDPRVSPLLFDDFAGQPPAFVQTAGFDPLRDEGDAYAAKLAGAGVDVVHDRYPSMIHGFFGMSAITPVAEQAITNAAELLRARV